MQCSKCKREAILYQPYSGQHLCGEHMIIDIETKAKRTIRQHRGMQPGDTIAVILRGNAADNALLFFLQKLTENRRDIRVSGVRGDPLTGNFTKTAHDTGATRIALSTTLEDASAEVLSGLIRGDFVKCPSVDPKSQGALPIITPFCHIPAGEIALYARILEIAEDRIYDIQEDDSLNHDVKAMLADYSHRHPAAPYAILNLADSLELMCSKPDGGSGHGA